MLAYLLLLAASTRADYAPSSTQEAWDNHFNAFATQNVTEILWDYTEDSTVVVWDHQSQTDTTYEGLAQIETLFEALFTDLYDLTELTAPVVDVQPNMVFLVWSCPSSGFNQVTDSFIFNDDHTIRYQTIFSDYQPSTSRRLLATEYSPANSSEAWANHFEAFAAQDVAQIMLDYDEDSQIRLYNYADEDAGMVLYNGTAAIEGMFTQLFEDLYDISSLAAPLIHEEDDLVFLVWENPGTGFYWATDTFDFNDDSVIRFQNIVLSYEAPTSDTTDSDSDIDSASAVQLSIAAVLAAFALLL